MAAIQRLARAVSIALFIVCFKTCNTTGCDDVSLSESGWFTSPNYPNKYPNSIMQITLINSTQPTVFKFTHFETEVKHDVLTIYKGMEKKESDVLIKVSGRNVIDHLPPIISFASQTLITFDTDRTDSYSGFNITYEPHKCQYELTAEKGLVFLPESPLNINCSWLITTEHQIILSFTRNSFDKCCDNLTIYDGPTKSYPVLANSMATTVPSALASSTNQMLITFTRSTESSCSASNKCCTKSMAGLNATYFSYGCQHLLSSESGWFSSKDGETNCLWLINAKQRFTISFNSFHINRKDNLTIYDGSTESSNVLFQTSPNDETVPTLIDTTGQQALIVFTSDGSVSSSRFKASYSSYKCGQELTSDSGSFTSPKHPSNYPNNANCSWLINSKQPIILFIDPFEVQENYDWVTIYDGPTESYPVLIKSSTTAPSSIVSTSNQVLATFTSDGEKNYKGFKAFYKPCQYISSSDSGWFTSPNHPLNYPDNSDICWLINATHPITLSFSHFNLEATKDWIKVYDGPTTSFELLKASSNESLPTSIISSGNQMLVTFTSDASNSFSGFNATYSPYRCQYVLSSESDWFTSPNYPRSYPENSNCSWLINATNRISLSFPSFWVEKGSDWVKVYDGPTTSSVELLKASSNESLYWSIVSTSNQLLVTFTSDRATTPSFGFNATYSQCQVHSNNSGWLMSPNYPENYPNDVSYCWIIKSTIQLEFSLNQFNTEEDYDWLRIYNGPTESFELILERAGYSLPLSGLKVTAREILVTFTSDASWSFSGFNLTYQSGCQRLNAKSSEQSFSFRSFPSYRAKGENSSCWLIDSEHPLMFVIIPFELEINRDFLRIYDGPSETFPLLLEATSNYTIPSSIVSTAKEVLFTFYTNSSYPRSGFEAIYSHYYPGITVRPFECSVNIFVNSSGYVLTSPNFPSSYPNDRCNWFFTSEPDSTIQITFTDFSTHPYDFVSVIDRKITHESDVSVPLMLTSGFNALLPLLCNYISMGNYMHVSFNPIFHNSQSKSMPSTAGFRATVTAVSTHGCGGNFSGSAGVLFSISEANAQRLISGGCVWYIQVDAGSQVSLTLNTLLEPNSSPDSYSLTVYEGHDLNNRFTRLTTVTRLFQYSKPFIVVSKFNKVAVMLIDVTVHNSVVNKCRPRNSTRLNLSYKALGFQNKIKYKTKSKPVLHTSFSAGDDDDE